MLSSRAYHRLCFTPSWEEIWEAGPYYARVADLLEDAQHYAIIAGWQIDSRLPMPWPLRPGAAPPKRAHESLREKILRICESRPDFRFYILMWDHSYVYVPERERWQGRVWETVHHRAHFVFDNRHAPGGAHHEKICIFDGKTALCGGIDLCGDRFDGPEHLYSDPRRSFNWRKERHGPYHDLSTQVGGAVCAELQNHLRRRWKMLSSVPFPDSLTARSADLTKRSADNAPSAGHAVYISRTRSDIDVSDGSRHLTREIEFLFRDLIRSAQKSIVLEGQYFWSRKFADWLIARMREMRGKDFEVVIVLAELARARSFTRHMATYEMTLLERLEAAAEQSGTRLVMGAPYSRSGIQPPRPIYIHSKLLLIDDRYLCVGSANFASRAMRIDTELNLTFEARTPSERSHLRRLGARILRHWSVEHRFMPFQTKHALHCKTAARAWRTWIPYQYFFDPLAPWGYWLKRRTYALVKSRPRSAVVALMCVSSAPLWIEIGLRGQTSLWACVYATLLASSWLLPIPFVATALLASLQLGAAPGARLAIQGLWIASLGGYLAARIYPSLFARLMTPGRSLRLHERLGNRRFESLVGVLADPRVGLRAKSIFQGLFCIPLPWFALGSGLVLPAACQLACRAAEKLSPSAWPLLLRENPALGAGLVLAWSCLRTASKGDLSHAA